MNCFLGLLWMLVRSGKQARFKRFAPTNIDTGTVSPKVQSLPTIHENASLYPTNSEELATRVNKIGNHIGNAIIIMRQKDGITELARESLSAIKESTCCVWIIAKEGTRLGAEVSQSAQERIEEAEFNSREKAREKFFQDPWIDENGKPLT